MQELQSELRRIILIIYYEMKNKSTESEIIKRLRMCILQNGSLLNKIDFKLQLNTLFLLNVKYHWLPLDAIVFRKKQSLRLRLSIIIQLYIINCIMYYIEPSVWHGRETPRILWNNIRQSEFVAIWLHKRLDNGRNYF